MKRDPSARRTNSPPAGGYTDRHAESGIDARLSEIETWPNQFKNYEITIEVPEMIAGIGTVITPEQVNQVKEAGAAFGMAPGMNPLVVREAHRVGLPFAPGIATPSDIEQALGCRCRLLKYFPAEACGGMEYLKSMSAPYAHLNLKYIPLGGLNANNVETYLEQPIVHALGGSWIAPRDLVKKQDWTAITVNARQASEIVAKARSREIA